MCYDNKMVKSPFNCVIFLLAQSKVAKQQKIVMMNHDSPLIYYYLGIYLQVFFIWIDLVFGYKLLEFVLLMKLETSPRFANICNKCSVF